MKKNKHIGSSFDEMLEEDGILAEVEATAVKRVIAYRIKELMKQKHITKIAMADKMNTSRMAIDRLLDPQNISVTLQTLEKASLAVGKKLKVELV